MIQSTNDPEVYKHSFKMAMKILMEKVCSLASQITRTSGSVSLHVVEGWAKGQYEKVFKQHLIHTLGSNLETESYLAFIMECKYIYEHTYNQFTNEVDQMGNMINKLYQNRTNHGK